MNHDNAPTSAEATSRAAALIFRNQVVQQATEENQRLQIENDRLRKYYDMMQTVQIQFLNESIQVKLDQGTFTENGWTCPIHHRGIEPATFPDIASGGVSIKISNVSCGDFSLFGAFFGARPVPYVDERDGTTLRLRIYTSEFFSVSGILSNIGDDDRTRIVNGEGDGQFMGMFMQMFHMQAFRGAMAAVGADGGAVVDAAYSSPNATFLLQEVNIDADFCRETFDKWDRIINGTVPEPLPFDDGSDGFTEQLRLSVASVFGGFSEEAITLNRNLKFENQKLKEAQNLLRSVVIQFGDGGNIQLDVLSGSREEGSDGKASWVVQPTAGTAIPVNNFHGTRVFAAGIPSIALAGPMHGGGEPQIAQVNETMLMMLLPVSSTPLNVKISGSFDINESLSQEESAAIAQNLHMGNIMSSLSGNDVFPPSLVLRLAAIMFEPSEIQHLLEEGDGDNAVLEGPLAAGTA